MSKLGGPIDESQVARVFRALANEHAGKREPLDRQLAFQRLVTRAAERRGRRTSPSWLIRSLIPAAASFMLVVALVVGLQGPTLEYALEGSFSARDGQIQSAGGTARLRFSDDSTLSATGPTSLSVSVVGKQAALTRLARGELHVDVRHREGTDFRFFAGPYEVRVVGTRFDLRWEPETSLFAIAMHEGAVHVTGPAGLDRRLSAGQKLSSLDAPLAAANVPPAPAAPASAGESAVLDVAPLAPQAAAPPQRTPTEAGREPRAARLVSAAPVVSLARAAAAPPAEDGWSELVAAGRFKEVVRLAERAGLERVMEHRTAADLKALAQAARYTSQSALAVETWLSVRRRFPKQDAAQQAAFFVGRIYDEQGRHADAQRWLDTYLSEAPAGVFVSEALGRKLSLARRLQGTAAARVLARDYLDRFPTGAYVRAARALLEER